MMHADFYQLSRDSVGKVLSSIAPRALATGARMLVVAAEREKLEEISAALWAAQPESFLAHGFADEANPDLQPILLSYAPLPGNGARIVALADGVWREEALTFDRALYFFDATTIEAARANWRTVSKLDGVEARFWRQDGGKWIQIA